MHQKLSFAILAFFVSCLLSPVSCPFARAEETLTITTYYPSPYGSYNQLRTYRDTHLATEGGSVGIGTTDPRAKLTINTPADYGGDTIRFASNAEPSVYYLNLNTAVTGGVVRWVFDQNNARINYPNVLAFDRGNVGIGMAQPIARLAVAGNQMDILVGDAGCSAGYGGIGFGALSGCNNYSLLGNGSSTLINRPLNGYLYFREANNDQMVITPGGSVGIGASGIFARLDVEGRVNVGSGTSQNRFASEEEQLQILTDAGTVGAIGLWQPGQAYAKLGNRANDSNFYITNSYSGSALGTADRSITLTRDGYVGIGTQIPGERLDVNGNIRASGTICTTAGACLAAGAKVYATTGVFGGQFDLCNSGTVPNLSLNLNLPNPANILINGLVNSNNAFYFYINVDGNSIGPYNQDAGAVTLTKIWPNLAAGNHTISITYSRVDGPGCSTTAFNNSGNVVARFLEVMEL